MIQRTYIDGNSVGHAAQHGQGKNGKKLTSGATETTAIFGMLKSMNVLLRARTTATPIVLWDGRSWRYEAFPDYKGTRTDTVEKQQERERYRLQRKHMAQSLHLLGISQLVAGNMEADDLAAILTRKERAKGNHVALITGDKDWIQLVEPGVAWLDHKEDRKVTASNFHEFTGFRTQKAFIHAKALEGDAGDNVKPRTGVGEETSRKLLSVFDCVHDFLQTPYDDAVARWLAGGNDCPKPKRKNDPQQLPSRLHKLHTDKEIQERFEWALGLMDLGHPDIPAPVGIKGTKAKLDRPAFEAFCAQFAFHSLLQDMDRFLKPFITLEEEFNS
jgi:5'-3' exonuclease